MSFNNENKNQIVNENNIENYTNPISSNLNINLNNLNEKEAFINDLFSIKNEENINIISSLKSNFNNNNNKINKSNTNHINNIKSENNKIENNDEISLSNFSSKDNILRIEFANKLFDENSGTNSLQLESVNNKIINENNIFPEKIDLNKNINEIKSKYSVKNKIEEDGNEIKEEEIQLTNNNEKKNNIININNNIKENNLKVNSNTNDVINNENIISINNLELENNFHNNQNENIINGIDKNKNSNIINNIYNLNNQELDKDKNDSISIGDIDINALPKFSNNINFKNNFVKVRENIDINIDDKKKESNELKKNLNINEHINNINNINLINKIKLKHQNKKKKYSKSSKDKEINNDNENFNDNSNIPLDKNKKNIFNMVQSLSNKNSINNKEKIKNKEKNKNLNKLTYIKKYINNYKNTNENYYKRHSNNNSKEINNNYSFESEINKNKLNKKFHTILTPKINNNDSNILNDINNLDTNIDNGKTDLLLGNVEDINHNNNIINENNNDVIKENNNNNNLTKIYKNSVLNEISYYNFLKMNNLYIEKSKKDNLIWNNNARQIFLNNLYFSDYILKEETIFDRIKKSNITCPLPVLYQYNDIMKAYDDNCNQFALLFQYIDDKEKDYLYQKYKDISNNDNIIFKINPYVNDFNNFRKNFEKEEKDKNNINNNNFEYIRYINEINGDSFYRSIIFNCLEINLIKQNIKGISMLILDIFKIYDLEPSIFSNEYRNINIKNVLICFSIIYDFIKVNLWDRAYKFFISSYNNELDKALIYYMKYNIFIFLSKIFFVLNIETDNKNKKKKHQHHHRHKNYNDYNNNHTEEFKYEDFCNLEENSEPRKIIFQSIPYIFGISLNIYYFEKEQYKNHFYINKIKYKNPYNEGENRKNKINLFFF